MSMCGGQYVNYCVVHNSGLLCNTDNLNDDALDFAAVLELVAPTDIFV